MYERQALEELEAARDFYTLLTREKEPEQLLRMLTESLILPYNQIMSDPKLTGWVLSNRELAEEARASLIQSQELFIQLGILKTRQEILPVPEVPKRTMEDAILTLNTIISGGPGNPAFRKLTDIYERFATTKDGEQFTDRYRDTNIAPIIQSAGFLSTNVPKLNKILTESIYSEFRKQNADLVRKATLAVNEIREMLYQILELYFRRIREFANTAQKASILRTIEAWKLEQYREAVSARRAA